MRPRAWIVTAAVILMAGAGALLAQQRREVVLAQEELEGTPVRVTATRTGFRYLRVGDQGAIRGAIRVKKPGYLPFPYTRSAMSFLAFQEVLPGDVLFLGMGAGSMPRFLLAELPDAKVQVVEDTELYAELATEHFELSPGPRLNVEVGDLREFVEEVNKRYDAIVYDPYVDGEIPYRHATREFYQEAYKKLAAGGVLVVHVWEKEETPTRAEMLAGMQDVFGQVYMMEVPNTTSSILVAARQRRQTTQENASERAREITQDLALNFDLSVIIARQYQYATKMRVDADVLTDDNAPLTVGGE
jgi:spermidine synthase